MVVKIETLTPEQESRNAEIRREWIEVGLSTKPADRAMAEAGVKEAYDQAGLVLPSYIFWAQSLPTGSLMASLLKADVDPEHKIFKDLTVARYGQIANILRSHVPTIGLSLAALSAVENVVHHGQNIPWLAFYQAMEELGVEGMEKLHGLRNVARSAGWWWSFDRAVVISERPGRICVSDDKQNLHCENGPAMLFRDGYAIYALNGVIVPEWLVMTAAGSLQDFHRESLKTDEQKTEFDKKTRAVS